MQLDRLTARIRPRTSWEGLDLGFALARSRFPALWGIWWLSALPVAAVAALALPARPDLWLLVVWWFKPLYEAPLLFWLSRAIFGTPLDPSGLWRERRQVLPLRLLPHLLWRRFQLGRSFLLPLTLLEGLRGRERRQRKRVIQGKGSTGTWLTLICLNLESVLWASALALVLFLVPKELPRLDMNMALFEMESAAYWLSVVLYWLAMSVIAPFYLAAGFALYLTRRTELEAWDLELVFRSAGAADRPRNHRGPSAAGSAALMALILWAMPPTDAAAQDLDPGQVRTLAAEILAGKDFAGTREVQTWVYVGEGMDPNTDTRLPGWLLDILEFFARGGQIAAPLVKWSLILVAAVVAALALPRILRHLGWGGDRRTTAKAPEPALTRLRGPGVERLPADVPAAVRSLIAARNLRAALALLYAASLARLAMRYGLEIPESATEQECLGLVKAGRPAADADLLGCLIRTWQRQAYGHRSPEADELTALLRDWQGWRGETN